MNFFAKRRRMYKQQPTPSSRAHLRYTSHVIPFLSKSIFAGLLEKLNEILCFEIHPENKDHKNHSTRTTPLINIIDKISP